METLYVRANAKRALRELEQNMYMSAYEEALKEELPKAMKEKAVRNVQKKYKKLGKRRFLNEALFFKRNRCQAPKS